MVSIGINTDKIVELITANFIDILFLFTIFAFLGIVISGILLGIVYEDAKYESKYWTSYLKSSGWITLIIFVISSFYLIMFITACFLTYLYEIGIIIVI